MADKLLSTIAGTGVPAGTKTRTVSGVIQITAGASGTIATISCPADRVAKLSYLLAATAEPDITIEVGGSAVISSATIDTQNSTTIISAGSITIGNNKSSDDCICGDLGEDIVIKKDTGSTAANIFYAYQLLE